MQLLFQNLDMLPLRYNLIYNNNHVSLSVFNLDNIPISICN